MMVNGETVQQPYPPTDSQENQVAREILFKKRLYGEEGRRHSTTRSAGSRYADSAERAIAATATAAAASVCVGTTLIPKDCSPEQIGQGGHGNITVGVIRGGSRIGWKKQNTGGPNGTFSLFAQRRGGVSPIFNGRRDGCRVVFLHSQPRSSGRSLYAVPTAVRTAAIDSEAADNQQWLAQYGTADQ